jgi:hypothetical protein
MENCSLVLRIPDIDSDAMDVARVGSTIDVWTLEVDSKVDLLKLCFKTLPRRVAKVGVFTPRYNTTEKLPSFTCPSGTYHAFLLTCSDGARKEDCSVDVTSTREELVGEHPVHISACRLHLTGMFSSLPRQEFIWSSVKLSETRCVYGS